MLIVLFVFWLILNGRWTVEIAVTGAVLSGLIYLFLCAFMGYSPKREWRFLRVMPRFAAYLCWLVGEVFRSGWAVMRLIWNPAVRPEPQVDSFRTRLRTGAGKAALADSITLTPGTVTVSVREDTFLVHALDTDFADGLHDSEMERRVCRVEGGEARG